MSKFIRLLIVLLLRAAESALESAPQRVESRALLEAISNETKLCMNGSDLAAAMVDSAVQVVFIPSDISMSSADWSSYTTPVALTRNLTVLGAHDVPSKWPVLDLDNARSLVRLTPGVTLNFSRLVLRNWRNIPHFQAPGLDLVAGSRSLSGGGEADDVSGLATAWNMILIHRTCLPLSIYLASVVSLGRPAQLPPGPQNATQLRRDPSAPPCDDQPSAPAAERCWPGFGIFYDVGFDAKQLDQFEKPVTAGYTVWLHMAQIKCETVMTTSCIATYGTVGCYWTMFPRVNNTAGPPPAPSSNEAQLLQTTGAAGQADSGSDRPLTQSSQRDGKQQESQRSLLAPLLSGVLGGAALLAMLAGLGVRVWRRRRGRYSPAEAAASCRRDVSTSFDLPGRSALNGGATEPAMLQGLEGLLPEDKCGPASVAVCRGPRAHARVTAHNPSSPEATGSSTAIAVPDEDAGAGSAGTAVCRSEVVLDLSSTAVFHSVHSVRASDPGGQPGTQAPVAMQPSRAVAAAGVWPFRVQHGHRVLTAAGQHPLLGASPPPMASQALPAAILPSNITNGVAGAILTPLLLRCLEPEVTLTPVTPLTPLRPGVTVEGAVMAAEVKLLPVTLGKGAFGRVVEGRYAGERVAVKLLNTGLLLSEKEGGLKVAPAEMKVLAVGDVVEQGNKLSAVTSLPVVASQGAARPSQDGQADRTLTTAERVSVPTATRLGSAEGTRGVCFNSTYKSHSLLSDCLTPAAPSGAETIRQGAAAHTRGGSGGATKDGDVGDPDGSDGGDGCRWGGAQLEALAQEVEVLARCQHPNIVRLLAASLSPPRVCLVMELMDTSLDRLLHGDGVRDMPLATVLHIGIQIARALAYLHPTILHRDLKPANVLIYQAESNKPVAKLADFGLSRLLQTVLVTQNPEVGTGPYMAPEAFDVTNTVITDRADIYGLGVILWEMLVGRRPWEGQATVQIAYAVVVNDERLPLDTIPPNRCPPKLRALILSCWDPEPERRPAAAEVVKTLVLVQEAIALAVSRAASLPSKA